MHAFLNHPGEHELPFLLGLKLSSGHHTLVDYDLMPGCCQKSKTTRSPGACSSRGHDADLNREGEYEVTRKAFSY